MHLSECTDLYSDSRSFDSDVRSCIAGWLFKSTTEFYGWDDRLHLNFMFGALCWGYSFAGIMMFFTKPKWTERSSFPHLLFATVLIFVQGEFSVLMFSVDFRSLALE